MQRLLTVAAVSLLLPIGALRADTTLPPIVQVAGDVTAATHPVQDVLVIAFGLKTFGSHEVRTDRLGSFRLSSLPSDVYRLVAVKQGFTPAVATVVPSSSDMRVKIHLRQGKLDETSRSDIWEIRRSLPADVLRELDDVMAAQTATAAQPDNFRFGGGIESLTGMNPDPAAADFAQTEIELKGSSPRGWSVDIAGRMHQMQVAPGEVADGRTAQSSGVTMALQTSPQQTVRIASVRNWCRLDQDGQLQRSDVDVESHRIEWARPDTNVEVRYISQQNVYRTPSLNSETFEVAGRRLLVDTERNNLIVDVKVSQESPLISAGMSQTTPFRFANIGSHGQVAVGESLHLKYGLRARVTETGQQWAPETGAEIRLSKHSALTLSGLYNIGRRDSSTMPTLTSTEDFASISTRYRYSLGVVSSDRQGNELSAVATVAAIDSVVSMLFDDAAASTAVWDGYSFRSGDIHRDLTLTYRKKVGNKVFFDVTTTAAETESDNGEQRVTKHFIIGNVRSIYRPSGTSMEVTYRLLDQPQKLSPLDASGERLNVRVGQSLHLPLDLKLLVGVDLARDHGDQPTVDESLQRRYVGGIALAF